MSGYDHGNAALTQLGTVALRESQVVQKMSAQHAWIPPVTNAQDYKDHLQVNTTTEFQSPDFFSLDKERVKIGSSNGARQRKVSLGVSKQHTVIR